LPAAASAVVPGPNGEIAFVSGRGAGGDASSDVYILSAAGDTTPEPLTAAAGQHRHPSWSPDRTQIVYALWDGATDRDLWVHRVGAPQRVRLEVTPLIEEDRPAWSPDGTKIAYESEVSDGSGQEDIIVYDLETDTVVNLTSSPGVIENKPVWSPDGETIYYSYAGTGGTEDADIYMEPSDNSDLVVGVDNQVLSSSLNEFQPALSPDGTRMCFTRGPAGAFNSATNDTADVYTVAASGNGAQTNLSDSAIGDYNCAWSPDGTRVAYVTGIFSNGTLVSEPASDAGAPSPLTANVDAVFDGNPDWAPNPSPTCANGSATTAAGTPVTVPLSCTDPDDQDLTLSIVNQPANGALGAINQGAETVVYTPAAGFSGSDSFTFKANDGTSDSNTATISLEVTSSATPPTPPKCKGRPATIIGTSGAETLTGTTGNDVIAAGGGRDSVRAGGGNDLVCGGDGSDKLSGQAGADKLLGEAGKDRLTGGGGKDRCVGAAGKDSARKCEKEKSI
jgi:Tol biopolymer transport system component